MQIGTINEQMTLNMREKCKIISLEKFISLLIFKIYVGYFLKYLNIARYVTGNLSDIT